MHKLKLHLELCLSYFFFFNEKEEEDPRMKMKSGYRERVSRVPAKLGGLYRGSISQRSNIGTLGMASIVIRTLFFLFFFSFVFLIPRFNDRSIGGYA